VTKFRRAMVNVHMLNGLSWMNLLTFLSKRIR